jgi:hypothetical protein
MFSYGLISQLLTVTAVLLFLKKNDLWKTISAQTIWILNKQVEKYISEIKATILNFIDFLSSFIILRKSFFCK